MSEWYNKIFVYIVRIADLENNMDFTGFWGNSRIRCIFSHIAISNVIV